MRLGVEPKKLTSIPYWLSFSCNFSFILSFNFRLIYSTANPKGLSCSSRRVFSIVTILAFSFCSAVRFDLDCWLLGGNGLIT